ncbi:hypothetical protein [Amycolatopsis sp. NPDC052450]|uniref:hypothetical protein n=1 Tax=Amycolatopsis sp. NPDC052450 TaxID=3363937 RepID=UPI0037C5FBAE
MLVLVGGVVAATVVGWIAGDVTAKADIPVIEEASEWIAPRTAVESDPPKSVTPAGLGVPISAVAIPSLPVAATPIPTGKSKSAVSLVERAVLSVKNLDDTAKSMASVVTAADEAARHTIATLDAAVLARPGDVDRDLMGVKASAAGQPVSNPVIAFSALEYRGSADGRTGRFAACRDESPDEPSSTASRARTSGHTAGKTIPPWSPLSLCGTSTSLAVACGGDHGSGAVLPGHPAQADRVSLDCNDDGHQAALAVVLRPDVTPG